ncbi:MAG: lytic transglycosylase domain-containing protein [Alphaproteobacteria bacterium]|nr:lytic transglycosylase domain-containing protein [Alphaproteobacteria bacterium]
MIRPATCRMVRRYLFILFAVIFWPTALFGAATIPSAVVPAQQRSVPLQTASLAVLSPADVRLYKRIFKVQAKGKWSRANRLIRRLHSRILMGHVLYQRYMHPTAYHSRYRELAKWMLKYSDLPEAKRIYALAKKKNGGRSRGLHKPVTARIRNFPADKPMRHPRHPVKIPAKPTPVVRRIIPPKRYHKRAERIDIRTLKTRMKRYLRRHDPERAEKRLWAFEPLNLLSPLEFNKLLGTVAAGYFFDNRDAKALALGDIAADGAREITAQPDWIAGLAAWRLGDCIQAAQHFANVAYSPVAGDWTAAAGAFWAARSYLVCREPEKVAKLLQKAASFPRTFYGLIAARQIGKSSGLSWAAPAFSWRHYDLIKDLRSVKRAIALTQTGKIMLADLELSDAWRRTRGSKHEALLGLAARLGLAGTQLKIGKIEEQKRMIALDSTLYPVPDMEPDGGFTLDRALIFAIIRQESEFNVWAKSQAGARGLMQVMPRTASYISRDRTLRFSRRIKLDDPTYNMALGQQYIQTMLGKGFADGNLFKTLTAYDAGPGNLRKWERKVNFQDDPLLFIESLPVRETRNYIERVVSNFWIYRMRMTQSTQSLDAVATGGWPMYIAQDINNTKRNQNHATR